MAILIDKSLNQLRRASSPSKVELPELYFKEIGEEWDAVSAEAKDLITKMLTKPDKRLNAEQVLEHPWLNSEKTKQKSNVNVNLNNLRNFVHASKFQKAVLTCMASQLSEHEIMDLRKIFLQLDKNGDGTLTFEELYEGSSLRYLNNW